MERKGRAFLDRVRAGYLSQVEQDPEGHLLIQADCDEDSVFEQLLTGLRQRLA